MDTLVPDKWFAIHRFPIFRGHFTCISVYRDPQKQSVIERFSQFGSHNKRFYYIKGGNNSGPQDVLSYRGLSNYSYTSERLS